MANGNEHRLTAAGVRLNDRWAVVGQTGSGKSMFALRYVAGRDYPNVIVWDEKSESLHGAGALWPWIPWAPIYTRVRDLANYPGGKAILRLHPSERTPAHYAAVLDWALRWAFENGGLVLEIDEAYGIVRKGGPALTQFDRALTEGRSYGLGLFICTQRPTRLPLFVLSEAQHYVQFRLSMEKDRKRMAECMELPVPLPNPLGEHGFYYHEQGWAAPLLVPHGINLNLPKGA